jgi:hypothetical protein
MKTTLAFLLLAVVAIEAAVPHHGHDDRFLGKTPLQPSYPLSSETALVNWVTDLRVP